MYNSLPALHSYTLKRAVAVAVAVQWGFVQYVKLIFSLFKSGGGADVIVGVQTWRQYDHGSHAVFLSIVTSISLIRQTYLCRCDC